MPSLTIPTAGVGSAAINFASLRFQSVSAGALVYEVRSSKTRYRSRATRNTAHDRNSVHRNTSHGV
jgi:hypothetical protein